MMQLSKLPAPMRPVWEQAVTLATAVRARPLDFAGHHAAVQALARLAGDQQAVPPAQPAPPLPARPPRVSVVICSIDPLKFGQISADYHARFPAGTVEIIGLHDARGLNEAYNRGIARARGDLLIFCHDDIRLLNTDFQARLLAHMQEFDVLGVSGATRVTGTGVAWAGHPHLHGWVAHQHGNQWAAGCYGIGFGTVTGAAAMDGVWMAVRREVAERIRFDDSLPGFHFYDLDFTWRCHQAGMRMALVPDLRVVHQSFGNFGQAWQEAARHFRAKFPELNAAAGPHHLYGAPVSGPDAVLRFYDWQAALAATVAGEQPGLDG